MMGSRIGVLARLVPLFLASTGCGGGDEEDPFGWDCYANSDLGTCECFEVPTGTKQEMDDPAISGVSSCSGYDTCFSYYDDSEEQGRCDCGDSGFMPTPSEAERRDTLSVSSCPDE